jgi:hypothetical protein
MRLAPWCAALLVAGLAIPTASGAERLTNVEAAVTPAPNKALHEVPPTAVAIVFLKPEANTLRMLVRVPLEALRDAVWPLTDQQYLVISRTDSLIRHAATLWIAQYVTLFEEGRPLGGERIVATRVSMPGDRSFAVYDSALANMSAAAVPDSVMLPWRQALADVWFEYPISSASSRFSIDPRLAHLGVRTTTVIRFLPGGDRERVLQFTGDPGLIHLDPSWFQSAFLFLTLGFHHIMGGVDHLMFLLCLVIPFRRIRPLVVIITSFTVAHSITLVASALDFAPADLWFVPLIETLIAVSILFMALENIVGARLKRRWVIVFVFGLVHGFGFSFFLRESLQFAGSHLGASLFAFNVGVELGQLLVILVAVPLIALIFRRVVDERIGTIIISAIIAHTAWHWMTERGGELLQYQFQMPAWDAASLAAAMRWLMLLLILVGVIALLIGAFGRTIDRTIEDRTTEDRTI